MSEKIKSNVNLLDKKDVKKGYTRWFFSNAISHSFSRYLGNAFLWAVMPALRKLYKDGDKLTEAYETHSMFYNTQVSLGGGTILGIVYSMENQRALEIAEGKEEEANRTKDLIMNIKTGLMGALAGVGDSLDSGTIQYILIALTLPLAQKGNPIGAIFPFLAFASYQYFSGLYYSYLGFNMGRRAASEVVTGKRMNSLVDGLSILGIFMMGVLGASFVNVSTPLVITLSGSEFVLQDILDGILPGALPLVVILGVYYYFTKKGLKITNALLGLTIILVLLGAIGLL